MRQVRETKTRYKTETAKIVLEKELVERLQYAADWKGISLEEAASKALTEYLGRVRRRKSQERAGNIREDAT